MSYYLKAFVGYKFKNSHLELVKLPFKHLKIGKELFELYMMAKTTTLL